MSFLLLEVSKRGEDRQSHMGNSEIVIGWRKMELPLWLSSGKKKKICLQYRRCTFDPWVWKIPWRRAWQPTLDYCLDNPRDRGAWQATVHGVTESDMTEAAEHARRQEKDKI